MKPVTGRLRERWNWRIARRVYGSGFSYTQIFQANKGRIVDPDLIYPGQVFEIPNVN